MTRKLIGLSALTLLLAGCGGSDEDVAPAETREGSGPQGEVRGGSITDAMLPVAMVQSESPKRGEDDGDNEESGGDSEEGDAE